MEAIIKMWKNTLNFKGRTTKGDFWWAVLGIFITSFIMGLLLGIFAGLSGSVIKNNITAVILSFYYIITAITFTSLSIRRLHDINKPGWYFLCNLIPVVGFILLIYLYCKPGSNEANDYGERENSVEKEKK